MSNKLFIGGLSWNTTSDDLTQAFGAIGAVTECKVVTDRDTGRSRGFGFVTYENQNDATRAIEQLDGSTLDGRAIRVNEANERPSRGRDSNRW